MFQIAGEIISKKSPRTAKLRSMPEREMAPPLTEPYSLPNLIAPLV